MDNYVLTKVIAPFMLLPLYKNDFFWVARYSICDCFESQLGQMNERARFNQRSQQKTQTKNKNQKQKTAAVARRSLVAGGWLLLSYEVR
jgi:hypothetical protein